MKLKIPILTISIAIAASVQTYAQNLIYDAIVSGSDIPQSTRFAGMGGAGTLMGGDLSSFVINPAGLSMCTDEFLDNFSRSWYIGLNGVAKTTEMEYYGTKNNIDALIKGDFNIGWTISKGVTFGFAFAKTVDFRTPEMNFSGKKVGNSIATMFHEPYSGYNQKYHNLLTDAEKLGVPNSSTHKECSQTWDEASRKGGIFSFTVPFSFRIAKVLFFGASASFNYLRSRDTCSISERSTWASNWEYRPIGDKTDGYGISLKGGAIFSPIKYLAVGAAYHHNTKYKVKNRYGYEISNDSHETKQLAEDSLTYHLETPAKFILSGVLILPRYGSFCADVEYTDYSQAKYYTKSDDRHDWEGDNQEINRCYRPAKNYHFGTEIIIDRGFDLQAAFIRLGYSMYENPYKNIGKDIDRTVMSVGLGFAFDKAYWDFAVTYTQYDTQRYLYHWNNVAAPYTLKQKSIGLMVSVKFAVGGTKFDDFSY